MTEQNGHSDMQLVPADAGLPDVAESGLSDAAARFLEPEEPLVDVGSLTYGQRQTYERQERVLRGYVLYVTILKAAEFAEVHYDCHYQWRKKDTLSWNERWQRAVDMRREFAEQKYVLDRLDNPSGNRGGDILAIAYMNKTDPEHWNRNVKLTHDAPNELIQQLRALQQLGSQKRRATELPEGKVVEGEAKVMPWEE